MTNTVEYQPTTATESLNQSNNPATATATSAMAPTTTSKPSSRSNSPPHNGSRSHSPSKPHSHGGFWSTYSHRLDNMNLSHGNEPAIEHHHHYHGYHSKPSSKPSSKPASGAATPIKKHHNPNFFKQVEARLDKAFETYARPEQEKAIEEARREGEERQRWGDKHIYGRFEKSLDRAHDMRQQ